MLDTPVQQTFKIIVIMKNAAIHGDAVSKMFFPGSATDIDQETTIPIAKGGEPFKRIKFSMSAHPNWCPGLL